ncbi:hypothetical protein R3P38DRAFT_3069681 [Favolaschia claudopus]|uniref:Secreted protein n=1 Tax=Favolaschia claudopus TaxID=2862362 RepID=A0AAW0A103_9AGAR
MTGLRWNVLRLYMPSVLPISLAARNLGAGCQALWILERGKPEIFGILLRRKPSVKATSQTRTMSNNYASSLKRHACPSRPAPLRHFSSLIPISTRISTAFFHASLS